MKKHVIYNTVVGWKPDRPHVPLESCWCNPQFEDIRAFIPNSSTTAIGGFLHRNYRYDDSQWLSLKERK